MANADDYTGPERREVDRAEGMRILDWRVLTLEQANDAREARLSLLEREYAGTTEKLKSIDRIEGLVSGLKDGLDSVKDAQNAAVTALRDSNVRTMSGVIIAIITVLVTFVLGHFGPIPGR